MKNSCNYDGKLGDRSWYKDDYPSEHVLLIEYEGGEIECFTGRRCLNGSYDATSVIHVANNAAYRHCDDLTLSVEEIADLPLFMYENTVWKCTEADYCPGYFYTSPDTTTGLNTTVTATANSVINAVMNVTMGDPEHEPADDGLSARAIAEIVATGILAAAAIGLCLRWCYRSYCNRGNDNQQTEEIGLNLMDSQQSEGLALQNGRAEFPGKEEQLSDIDQGSNAEVPITLEDHPAAPSGRPSGIISRIWSIMPGFIRKTQEEAASVV